MEVEDVLKSSPRKKSRLEEHLHDEDEDEDDIWAGNAQSFSPRDSLDGSQEPQDLPETEQHLQEFPQDHLKNEEAVSGLEDFLPDLNKQETASPDLLQDRNTNQVLDTLQAAFLKEATSKPSAFEEALMFVRKIALLDGIPNKTMEKLLTPEALGRLQLLKGFSMQQVDRKLDSILLTTGLTTHLVSGTMIRFIPLTQTHLRKSIHDILGKRTLGREIILYWDGFRQFRAKGGSLGLCPFCTYSLFCFIASPYRLLLLPL